jgi:AcrR family transcriptional regulator
VYIANGFANTRVEDVAREAGLSKGAVYFYFKSKRDLFVGLVLDDHERAYHMLDAIEHAEDAALQKLLRVGLHYVGQFASMSDEHPTRFYVMMCELAMRDAELQEECQGLHTRFVDAITRILAQGMHEGEFRDMNPLIVARLLKATIDGFASHMAIGAHIDGGGLREDGFITILRGILRDPAAAESILATYLPPVSF